MRSALRDAEVTPPADGWARLERELKTPAPRISVLRRYWPRIAAAAAAVLIFLGAVVSFGFAWDMADICQCMLAFINIPSCVLLGGVAYRALDDYTAQKKEGKNPTYKAAANGVKEKTDFWT